MVLPEAVRRELASLNVTARSNRDELYRGIALLLVLLSIAAWVWCLVLSERKDTATWWGFSRPLMTGMASYFVAIIASEIKEAQ